MKTPGLESIRETLDKSTLFRSIVGAALANHYSFALWRLPNQEEQDLIVSTSNRIITDNLPIEELEPGFVLAPFRGNHKTFLPADYHFRFNQRTWLDPTTPAEQKAQTWFHNQPQQKSSINFYTTSNDDQTLVTDDKSKFINFVYNGIALIESGQLEKIVPSRTKTIAANFDLLHAFEKLCKRYPSAMISLISTPEHGTWLGATPEVLVSIEQGRIFKTVALAGTKVKQEGTDSKNVAWTQKEIEEQALVERYIISCFKKIRLRDYHEHGPKTIEAGNLLHLKSDFMVDMQATNFPQLGSVMLSLLHPTSAVCGMPKETALNFLDSEEGYNRELYSGYLGPVNVQQNTHLFVNLRCLQWKQQSAQLYAGAGVTIDSVPEKEWEETEMKMNTLMNVIF